MANPTDNQHIDEAVIDAYVAFSPSENPRYLMSSIGRRDKSELLVDGFIKSLNEWHIKIPTDIIKLFFSFYYEPFQILKFSDELCSKMTYEFYNDYTYIKRTLVGGIRYIIVDQPPVNTGLHCWRLKVNTRSGWIMYGISEKKSFDYIHSTTYNEAFGIAKFDEQWYPKPSMKYWPHHNICDKLKFKELIHGEVDMLLDLDNDTLSVCVVGCDQRYEGKLMSIPKNNNGWVPHFNTNSAGQTLQVAKVPPYWYAKMMTDAVFPVIHLE